MEDSEYHSGIVESQSRALWETRDIYRYDAELAGSVFSIDTPPPYVSASHLHVGHAMSYSQADFIVRYRRMCGDRVYYPMGFDDNGLPTERFVEQKYGIKAADIPRAEFVQLCLKETEVAAAAYEGLWRQLGLSVDWSQTYSTIDERCQRTSQTGFIRLHELGHITRRNDPIVWCVECGTSLAQADIEDLERKGRLHQVTFTAVHDRRELVIATTRPELLVACVALYYHPGDARYQSLADSTARVPIFGHEVPILADSTVDPEFGTGLMMVCTFGDSEDVVKWRKDRLPLRLRLGPDGRFDGASGILAGRSIEAARQHVLDLLKEHDQLIDTVTFRQVVGVHERCSTPVEFQIRPQWFVNIMDHRDRFRVRAEQLEWAPTFMKVRLDNWIDGLKWDWNITRQRHYGVPFPAWYRLDGNGQPIEDQVLLAAPESLPVDPRVDVPTGFTDAQRDVPGGFSADPDVMDTWMTSSLSPQINAGWASTRGTDRALMPMSLRVQAFEIIRTWLFYSIVQAELLQNNLPWKAAMISGWGLNEQGKKISKRDLEKSTDAAGFNRYVPNNVIDRYGADALRLWATSARLGQDLRYNEKDVKAGRKLVVKLWNVGRFVDLHLEGFNSATAKPVAVALRTPVDQWVLSHLEEVIRSSTEALDGYDFAQAQKIIARFFWLIMCDRYLEMIKERFLEADRHSEDVRLSAQWTLFEIYRVVLGLFAPFIPFVTEELYQRRYGWEKVGGSIHTSRWPEPPETWRTDRTDVDAMDTILNTVKVLRAQFKLHSTTRIKQLIVDVNPERADLAPAIAEPLRSAARADVLVFGAAAQETEIEGIAVGIEP